MIISNLHNNVYSILKDNAEDNLCELKKLMECIDLYGLESGVISDLITYEQCEYFVKCNLSDILIAFEEMINEGIVDEMPCDLSKIAWISFEYITREIYLSIQWPAMINEE